jgi:hypothetical protein
LALGFVGPLLSAIATEIRSQLKQLKSMIESEGEVCDEFQFEAQKVLETLANFAEI